MTGNELSSIVDLIAKGGFPSVMVIIMYGGHKKWWVFGWQFHAMQADRDMWRETALKGMQIANKAVDAKTSFAA